MRISHFLTSGLLLSAGLILAAPAGAQSGSELSAEELESLFSTQKTRGLVIAPSAGAAAAASTGTAVETAATATDYVPLAKDEQVNIQVSFDFDSAALREDQKPKLATLCEVMKKVDVQMFRIVGHTDASGPADYNERLSLLRAEEVKRHLVTDCGLPESRLQAVGVGEQFPFNEAEPRADENRRVEFQALS